MNVKTGEYVWFDIPVRDFEKSKAFYGELLGWKFEPQGDAKTTSYWMVKVGDKMLGGLRKPEEGIVATDAPVLYFAVEKLEPSVDRAKKLGATLVGKVVDIGNNMGRFQWFRDPDKNLVAIWAQS